MTASTSVNKHPIMTPNRRAKMTPFGGGVFFWSRGGVAAGFLGGRAVGFFWGGAQRGGRHPMFREACLPEHRVNKFFSGGPGPALSRSAGPPVGL